MSELPHKHLEILRHTRHRAAGGLYCGDSPEMQSLVRMGYMVSAGKKAFCPDEYFRITSRGIQALNAEEAV